MEEKRAFQNNPIDGLNDIEKEVVILLSDMVGYSRRASSMVPAEIKSFMLEYHVNLKTIVHTICGSEQQIEPSAGDGAVAVFEMKPGEKRTKICDLALNVALEMVYAMEEGVIAQTRIGLFSGNIIEAVLDGQTMRFGAGFSVASRLEELCDYFGISILMGREVANQQTIHSDFITRIGKITPNNFAHPVHIFSLYRPGIHRCPADLKKSQLLNFIEVKNVAVELFCGNELKGILPDFSLAKKKLLQAQTLFIEMTGQSDMPTERLLEYIGKNSHPGKYFNQVGMRIWDSDRRSRHTGVMINP